MRQGMAQLLELHGFLVVDAAAGEQALAHLHTDPKGFALMLLDLRMPGAMNGSDVRRTSSRSPNSPISPRSSSARASLTGSVSAAAGRCVD